MNHIVSVVLANAKFAYGDKEIGLNNLSSTKDTIKNALDSLKNGSVKIPKPPPNTKSTVARPKNHIEK